MKTSNEIGNAFEKAVMKDCNGTRSPGSGQIPGRKYDITDASERLFIECKSRKKASNRGLKVETKWITKLVDDCYRDMDQKKIPALAVTTSNNQRDYIVLVYGPRIVEAGNLLGVRLYGWPQEDMAISHKIAANAKSFAIKKPKTPGFFNVVVVPIGKVSFEFWLYDRDMFLQLAEALQCPA